VSIAGCQRRRVQIVFEAKRVAPMRLKPRPPWTRTWQEIGNASGNGTDTDAQVTLPSSSDRIRFFRIPGQVTRFALPGCPFFPD
jgi:hypothetical protein